MDLIAEGQWRTSSRCWDSNDTCVAVRIAGSRVEMRDTKQREGPTLRFERTSWAAFIDGIRGDEFVGAGRTAAHNAPQ